MNTYQIARLPWNDETEICAECGSPITLGQYCHEYQGQIYCTWCILKFDDQPKPYVDTCSGQPKVIFGNGGGEWTLPGEIQHGR